MGLNTILKANIEGTEQELYPKVYGDNVYLDDKTTLTPKIAEMVEAINAKAKDTDVMDIKIKYDGSTANTPGDAVREQIRELKGDLANSMTLVESTNLLNPNNTVRGYIQESSGKVIENSSYFTTDYIKVNENDVIKSNYLMRFAVCFSEPSEKGVITGTSIVDVQTFTVPTGAKYIRCSITSMATPSAVIIAKNVDELAFEQWHEPYYVGKENFYTDETTTKISEIAKNKIYDNLMDKNLLDVSKIEYGKYQINQNVSTGSTSYSLSDYLSVVYGNAYYFFKSNLEKITKIRSIAYFNKNKQYLGVISTDYQKQYVCDNENVAFIRVTFRNSDVDSNGMMMSTDINPMRFIAYGDDGIIKKEFVDTRTESVLHCYLPPIIYVGVGRTIELYNSLVCLESDKYHLDWVCPVGKVYKNKWACTGESNKTGSFAMTLNIYNDSNELIKTLTSTVKVSENTISTKKNIIPVGDSTTNNKAWISEVQTLSDGKVKFVGTRGSNGISHEGRSGATADWYNSNSSYTFDSNYIGNPNVSGSSNPFWDGSKFSLSHYVSSQSGYVDNPDAIQILLGTNGIANTTNVVNNIKDMVDSIISEYPSMPIFVCNTIYRANQLLDSVGADGYISSHDYPFSADLKVMNLQIAISETFKDYSTVYIVPLGICMDRDNNFGRVEVPVNPRLTDVKEYVPQESVHPQNPGYMQMADVMYSAYCVVLN